MEQQLHIEQWVERSYEEIQVISSDDEEQGAYEQMQWENSPSPPQWPQNPEVSVSPPHIFYPWHTPVGRPFVSKALQYNQQNHSEVSNAADTALDNHQMEQVLPHRSTSIPVDNCERSAASQVKERQDSSIDSVNKSIAPRKHSTTYHCAECDKQYTSKSYLTIHSRIHTGEKPYKCAQCDYATTDKESLLRHETTRLADVKPFKCLICGGTFKYKCNLTFHQRTQHSANPFKCSTCNLAFTSRYQLTLHKVVHTDAPIKSNVARHRKTHNSK